MNYSPDFLHTVVDYADALTSIARKCDREGDDLTPYLAFVPVVCCGEIVGVLNRDVDASFDFVPCADFLPQMRELVRGAWS